MRKPPSRIRYERENPTISFRMDRETYEKIKALQRKSGKSLAEVIKESLGFIERSTEEAYQRGFEDGYLQAKNLYRFSIQCAECGGELVLSNSTTGIDNVKQLLKGFTHSQCPEAKGEVIPDDEQGH